MRPASEDTSAVNKSDANGVPVARKGAAINVEHSGRGGFPSAKRQPMKPALRTREKWRAKTW